jgi:hypothetical protein
MHLYFTNADAWCHALRGLMGYPAHEPVNHSLSFCTSASRNIFEAMQITQIAADVGRDLVHVAFEDGAGEIPAGISLAVRTTNCVEWLSGCALYAAGETSRIEILSADRRWLVGPRHVLTAAKLPPKSRRQRGEEIAARRWRQAFEAVGPLSLTGSMFVPEGRSYADAVPRADLRTAA